MIGQHHAGDLVPLRDGYLERIAFRPIRDRAGDTSPRPLVICTRAQDERRTLPGLLVALGRIEIDPDECSRVRG
jgi:hypothetical protein